MPVHPPSIATLSRAIPALLIALAVAGCSAATATPVDTATPAATETPIIVDVSTPTPEPTAEPTPTPTPEPSPTPALSSTPAPSATEAPSPTPAESPTPTPTPTPTPSATSRAAGCTGTAEHQAFFAEAAGSLHFAVYCAALPSSWWFQSGSYSLPNGGFLQVEYKTTSGATFDLWEGGWCPPNKACIGPGALIGTASFGSLSGDLYLNNTAYTLRVGTTAQPTYLMVGSGMTQAQFTAWAAALIVVPKS